MEFTTHRNMVAADVMKYGHEWEMKVFGCHSGMYNRTEYVPWRSAVRNAISSQDSRSWDPVCPKTKTAHEVFLTLKKCLRGTRADELMFYCAIGMDLDFWHSTDAFFLLRGKIVCIDLTTCPQYKRSRGRVLSFEKREIENGGMKRFCRRVANVYNNSYRFR